MLLLDTGQKDSLQLIWNYIYSTYINFNLKYLPEFLSSCIIKFYQLIFFNLLQQTSQLMFQGTSMIMFMLLLIIYSASQNSPAMWITIYIYAMLFCLFKLCSFLCRCAKAKWRKKCWFWKILVLPLYTVNMKNTFFNLLFHQYWATSQRLFTCLPHTYIHSHSHKYILRTLELALAFCSPINKAAFFNKDKKLIPRPKK